jgi:D-arabinose 5-phosphate isomerase GutQ
MLATTSTMAVVAVFDAICIALMEYSGYTREQFAVIHPGGAVGERLSRGES